MCLSYTKHIVSNFDLEGSIYDVVFNYIMEDNDAAKLLISTIIGHELISEITGLSVEVIDAHK